MYKHALRKYPLVLVEWHDTVTQSSWKAERDLDEKPPLAVSIGWRVKSNREYITLTAMRSEGDCSARQIIPRGCIKSIKVIKNE